MPSDRLRYVQIFAVLFCLLAAGRAAHAQTVILTKAAAGTNAELLFNDTQVATGIAGADGLITLQAESSVLGQRQIDARVYVDVCGPSRRIIITESGTPPPPSGSCTRTQLEGLYHVQRISSLVIDISTVPPTMLLRQGRAPREWIEPPRPPSAPRNLLANARTGLMLFGGGGLGTFSEFPTVVCGSVETCEVDRAPDIAMGGVSYWFLPFFGAEAAFMKPTTLSASSDSDVARFDTEREGGIITLSGVGGVPLGPIRLYGKLGATYHRATLTTTQFTSDQVIIVEGNPVLIAGSSQTTQMRTGGWGAIVGAGAEYWLTRRWAIYADLGQLTIKGGQEGEGEGKMDDFLRYATIGVRFNLPNIW
jgi:hypothetical protein